MKYPGVGTPHLTCVASSAPNHRGRGEGGVCSGLAGACQEAAHDDRRISRADEGGGASAAAVRSSDATGRRPTGLPFWAEAGSSSWMPSSAGDAALLA